MLFPKNANDLAAKLNALDRSQAVIEFNLDDSSYKVVKFATDITEQKKKNAKVG